MERPYTVLLGNDGEAINTLMGVHSPSECPRILDVTYNTGKIWKGTNYKPVRMDIDSDLDLDVVGDFKNIPFSDSFFQVIIFDPPHLPSDIGGSSIWRDKYNTPRFDEGRKKDNVSALFKPFLLEAKRVLTEDGIVLAKIADLVHNHRQQWQQVDFVNAVREVGMTPCDMMIKCDPKAGNLKSSKWKNVNHLRKNHCYWIVVRNSKRCERKQNGRKQTK